MSALRIFRYLHRKTTSKRAMAFTRGGTQAVHPTNLGVEFNYESMEDELTCPVCLELYADPLMLPCSHSVCKKCIQDILDSKTKKKRSKKESVHIECPSCRKELQVGKEKLSILPRNLALENIVIRYTEERSRSIRNSLNLDNTVSDVLLSSATAGNPQKAGPGIPEFPSGGSARCELCEDSGIVCGGSTEDRGGGGNTAAWYCVQCQVGYCHACFAKYHPKRGALGKHKIRPYSVDEDGCCSGGRSLMCTEHAGEAAILFCDTCQVPACPLCVCEGQGQHGGHRMLGHEVAVKKVEENLKKAKEESDWLVATVVERKGKMEARAEEVKNLHTAAASRIEQQYKRLLADITSALQQERDRSLDDLAKAKDTALKQTKAYVRESNNLAGKVETLSSACHKLSGTKHSSETLCRAKEVAPLVAKLRNFQKDMEGMSPNYDSTIKDKTTMVTLQTAVGRFSKNAMKVIQVMMDDRRSGFPALVPRILTPAATSGAIRASTADLAPRMLNKSLITWGFSSTTFTGERLSASATWTVTIEKNVGTVGTAASVAQNGYVFGVGVAGQVLNVKDAVGANTKSYGVVLNMGTLCFAHDGKMEVLEKLDTIPVTVAVSVGLDAEDYVVLAYKIEGQGLSLLGNKVIRDPALKKEIFPVFTVSQRVKLLFPTCV